MQKSPKIIKISGIINIHMGKSLFKPLQFYITRPIWGFPEPKIAQISATKTPHMTNPHIKRQ